LVLIIEEFNKGRKEKEWRSEGVEEIREFG
jgi:hypothetical protein